MIYIYYNRYVIYTNKSLDSELDNYRFGEIGETLSTDKKVKITYSMKLSMKVGAIVNLCRTFFTFARSSRHSRTGPRELQIYRGVE